MAANTTPFRSVMLPITGAVNEISKIPGQDSSDSKENRDLLRQLVAATAYTNRLIAVTGGLESGIPDRRSGQVYHIDVGVEMAAVDPASADFRLPSVIVNTQRIAEQVCPSLGDVDLKFTIGVDSFFINRFAPVAPPEKVWPIAISCDRLQAITNARYLTQIIGEAGAALSGMTAQAVFYGELPNSLEFKFGYMSNIPVDSAGTLSRTVFPLAFGSAWAATEAGLAAPRIPGTTDLLWASSNIYSIAVRLYVIPTISPRVRVPSDFQGSTSV